MRLSLDVVVRATGGTLVSSETGPADIAAGEPAQTLVLTGAATDNRTARPGDLFICIPGERADGHDFAAAAVQAGASAVLAQRDPFAGKGSVPVILVDDTVKALGRLAHAWRTSFRDAAEKPVVIGVTGTAGKTTVKELLAQVLGRRGRTAKNHLNLNNQIGLPMSMLAADGSEAFWVMEAGISLPGDMDELASILEPDIALILNVGAGHTEGLGDRGVAHYKARLLKYLAAGGTAVVSADYPDLVREARAVRQDLVFFSTTGRQVDYRSAYVVPAGESKGLFRLWLDGESVDAEAPFRGVFGAENVIAVAAVAHRLGLSPAEIAQGMAQAQLPCQRFACERFGSWIAIDDSYNANPLSMLRTLDAAADIAVSLESESSQSAPFICVLGEMRELGAAAGDEHEKLGRRLAELKTRAIFWKGGQFEQVAAGLKAGGYSGSLARVESEEDFLTGLAGLAAEGLKGGVMLFKGSRSNRLEVLFNVFKARAERAGGKRP